MSNISQWIDSIKEVILDALTLLSYFDLLIFVGLFLVFVLLYVLSCICAYVRFLVPQILRFLAYIVLLSTPWILWWVNQNVLYKSKVDYVMAKRLEYSPTFYVDATISNQGKFKIKKCYFVVDVLRDSSTWRSRILNFIVPYKRYKYKITEDVKVNDSINFQKTINDFPYTLYQMHLRCYGGR